MTALTLGTIGEELNLLIRQGATFGPMQFAMTNLAGGSAVDLTGVTFQAQIRRNPSSKSVVATIACTVTNAVGGLYELGIDEVVTAAIPCADDPESSENKYVWDLEMVDSLGRVIPIYYGTVTMFREVTRV